MKKVLSVFLLFFCLSFTLAGCTSIKSISYFPEKYTTVKFPNNNSTEFVHFNNISPNTPIALISSNGGTDYDTYLFYIHHNDDILILKKQFGSRKTEDTLMLFSDSYNIFTDIVNNDNKETKFIMTFKNVVSSNHTASFDLNIIEFKNKE